MNRKLGFVLVLFVGLLLLPVSGYSQDDDENGAATRGELILWVEALIFLFLAIAITANTLIVRQFGISAIGVPFIYMLSGVVLMGATRVMYALYEFRVLDIADDTLEFWWHLFFYLGMTCFLYALNKIKRTASAQKVTPLRRMDTTLLVGFGIVAVALYVIAEPLDEWFVAWFSDSLLDDYGVQHFIAFVFAGFVAARLNWILRNMRSQDLGELIRTIIPSFFIFLTLMSLNHLWELLTESLGIIELPESTIESVEQLFWLPAFVVVSYGLFRLNRAIRDSTSLK